MNLEVTGASVTATPHYRGEFLIVRRSWSDVTLPGHWAFPGGRVQYGIVKKEQSDGTFLQAPESETLTQAAVREVKEETGLRATGAFYVDSYPLGKRAAAHFCLDVSSKRVQLNKAEVVDYAWIRNVEEMKNFVPRIDGLDNHIHLIALLREQGVKFQSFEQLDLIPKRYLNRGQ